MHRLLLRAAKALARGEQPPALGGAGDFRSIRGAEKILAEGEDWRVLGTDEDPSCGRHSRSARGSGGEILGSCMSDSREPHGYTAVRCARRPARHPDAEARQHLPRKRPGHRGGDRDLPLTPTKCQARTRLYRNGTLVSEGFPVAEISDHLADERATIWLDLRDPDPEDLAVLGDEFGLHPVAIEDAVHDRERPKLDRYRTHLFLTAYGARLDRRVRGAGDQRARRVRHSAGADHRPQGRRARHRQGRRPLGRQSRPRRVRRRLPAVRAARLHRGRALRGGAEPGRRGSKTSRTTCSPTFRGTCGCSGAASSCARAWCCCAGW